jgi:serine phosphatase RsbU (regulator of sigma subunit)
MPSVLVLIGALALGQALRRDRAGLVRAVGDVEQADAVLVDLRERARSHARLSQLPPGWHVESDLRPARGESFGGDFLVAAHRDGDRLDLVLVDVSGKGGAAGSRALLYTGAFGALLQTLPRAELRPAANRYVLHHGGDEGFATAVHASVDLAAGTYALSVAGHPPPALFRAGSGRWELVEGASGPLLGVVPDAGYGECHGSLAPGDALLLYTDGLVESPRLDVVRGIDRLLGFADTVLCRGAAGGAALIADASRAAESDDGGLVVIRRALIPA